MDHLAHPTDGPATFAVVDGKCPASHPVKIPQVHYEVCPRLRDLAFSSWLTLIFQIVWDTTKFNNKAEWPEDGSQPFVLSTGDP